MLVVLMGFAGCTQDELPWFTWQPGTTPHAILADGSEDPVWTVMVDRAHEKWADALAGVGCADPFTGVATHPVELLDDSQWPEAESSANGYTTNEMIGVKGTVHEQLLSQAYETVMPHELGHALGLVHVEPTDDPLSVMIAPARNRFPSALDVKHAAENLGCGDY